MNRDVHETLQVLTLQYSLLGRLLMVPCFLQVCNGLESLVQLSHSPCDIEAMRVYLILPECHFFDQPKHYANLLTPFGQSILNLDKPAAKFLG